MHEAYMTLEELGAALRAEREKRGLSIEDVANHLKIGARLLRALEEGDASSLPHLAYAKGFIRSYSSYLGMAAEEVNEAVCALGGTSPAVPQPVYTPEESLAPGRSLKWLGVLIVLALVAGGAYVAWQQGALEILSRQTRRLAQPSPPLQTPDSAESVPGRETSAPAADSAQTPSQTPAAKSEAFAPAASPSPEAAPVAAPASAASTASTGGVNTPSSAPAPAFGGAGGSAQNAAPASAWGLSSTTAAPAQPALGQNATQPAQPADGALSPGQHKVIITATEECWIHSNADNTDTRQFSLRKGDTFALTFTKSLELKLGNAGGVRIRYNGEDMPAPGQSGQVRTLTFPPSARQ